MSKGGVALFAIVTPTLMAGSTAVFFAICLAFSIATSVIALVWIPRFTRSQAVASPAPVAGAAEVRI